MTLKGRNALWYVSRALLWLLKRYVVGGLRLYHWIGRWRLFIGCQ